MKSLLVALPLFSLSLFLFMVWPQTMLANEGNPNILAFLIMAQVLAVIYFSILAIGRKCRLELRANRGLWMFLILVGLVTRLTIVVGIGEHTTLSDDVYRYVWEGKLVANGGNPYVTAPEDMESCELADSTIFPNINHPWLPTIYPPLSMGLFTVAYLISGDSVLGFKWLSFFFELATALGIMLLIRRYGLPHWTFLVYWFSPLVLIEFLVSNHQDILAMPFLIGTILFAEGKRPILCGLSLAAMALIKPLGLFIAPAIFLFFIGRQRIQLVAAAALVGLLAYLPFVADAGLEVFGSLWTYLGTWQYNGSVFQLLALFMEPSHSRIVCLVGFVLAVSAILFARRKSANWLKTSLYLFVCYVVFAPSLFPWYLVWMLPLLVLYPNPALLSLSGTIFLSYYVLIGYYADGEWSKQGWVVIVEYVPFYGLAVWLLVRHFRKKRLCRL